MQAYVNLVQQHVTDEYPSKDPSLVRAVTWNVHGWKGVNGRSNVDRVVAVLRPLAVDVLALQDVGTDVRVLRKVQDQLHLPYRTTAKCGTSRVALLSRRKITEHGLMSLGEKDFAVWCACGKTLVATLQLSAFSESFRTHQLNQLLQALPGHAVVLGDFRACHPLHYDRVTWSELAPEGHNGHALDVFYRNGWCSVAAFTDCVPFTTHDFKVHDLVFARPSVVRFDAAGVVMTTASTHLPVYTDLNFISGRSRL